MEPVSHYDLTVILVVSGVAQVTALAVLGVSLVKISRMVTEAQRLTRAVAGLVVQEEEKTRAMIRPR
jgi:predicted metal-binding membrane protein